MLCRRHTGPPTAASSSQQLAGAVGAARAGLRLRLGVLRSLHAATTVGYGRGPWAARRDVACSLVFKLKIGGW